MEATQATNKKICIRIDIIYINIICIYSTEISLISSNGFRLAKKSCLWNLGCIKNLRWRPEPLVYSHEILKMCRKSRPIIGSSAAD